MSETGRIAKLGQVQLTDLGAPPPLHAQRQHHSRAEECCFQTRCEGLTEWPERRLPEQAAQVIHLKTCIRELGRQTRQASPH